MATTHRLTFDQVKGGRAWSRLEQDLLDECKLGRDAYLPGKEDCPKDQTDPDRRVRPTLIRYLLEGGCKNGVRPHPKGVNVSGAWIDGVLDCEGCVTQLDLALTNCLFEQRVIFRDARLGALYLSGSRAKKGVNLHRLQTEKSVHLRGGFHATGEVNLVSAKIAGNLEASNAQFEGKLILDSAQIGSGFFWEGISGTVPLLGLTEAKVGTLADDAASWERVKELRLSGFRYDHIQSDMGISDRLTWLARKHERPLLPGMPDTPRLPSWIGARDKGFDPQPYSQLAKVLEADGNRSAAARVMAVREDLLRRTERGRAWARLSGQKWYMKPASLGRIGWRMIWTFIFKYVFGYGHHPARALLWMLGIWVLGFVLYGAAYASGQMVPNSDVILTSADWLAAATPYFDGSTDIRPAIAWADTPAGKDYETFSAGLYALDLFVPLDALGQETTWAPSRAYGWLGTIAYWARMPIQLAGWIITAVGAAVLTGLIGRKE